MNFILGQSHFIKTVEDLYEVIVGEVPGAKFGLAFCEASGPCLVRTEGNDDELKETAIRNAHALAAGHSFVLLIKNAFPINVLNAIKQCREVCSIYCATANPVEVIIALGIIVLSESERQIFADVIHILTSLLIRRIFRGGK